jgi:hypothetical protein
MTVCFGYTFILFAQQLELVTGGWRRPVCCGIFWRLRHNARASTPKYVTMWKRGGGTAAQSRTNKSSGVSTNPRLPSFQAFLNSSSSVPSGR